MRNILTILTFFLLLCNANKLSAQWMMVYGTENDQEHPWEFDQFNGDRAHDVLETSDGNFVFTGQIALDRDDDNRRGLWVCKTDKSGEIVWQKNYGFGIGISIAETEDGNLVIAGSYNSLRMTGPWIGMLRVLKIDQQGNILWNKFYGGNTLTHLDLHTWPGKIRSTSDGGYIIAGRHAITEDTELGSMITGYDPWIIKIDGIGNVEWENAYNEGSLFSDCRQTPDGSYIAIGTGVVVKIDTDGYTEWSKTIALNSIHAVGVISDPEGNNDGYILAGRGGMDWVLFRVDHDTGDLVWQKSYDLVGFPTSIQQTADNNLLVSGMRIEYDSGYYSDGVIMKTDTEGNLLWVKTYGGDYISDSSYVYDGYLYTVNETSDGGFVAAGYTRSLGFGDPDEGGYYTDALIIKIDSVGEINDCDIDAAAEVTVTETDIAFGEYTGTAYNSNPLVYQTSKSYIDSNASSLEVCRQKANLKFHQQEDTPDPAGIGEYVTYTLVLENMGPQDATGVVLDGSVSSGENLVVGWSGDITYNGLNYTCNVGDLAVGETETFSILVQPTETGILESNAKAVSDQYDPWPDNNVTFEETTVETPGLSVQIQDNPDPTFPGGGLSYTVRVVNYSEIDATGVILTDTLPPGYEPLIYLCSVGEAPTLSGGVLTCSIGNLNAGQSAVLTIGGTLTASGSGTIINTAQVTADGIGPLPQHLDTEETAVQYPDLSVEITDTPDPVRVGYYLIYEVTAQNNSDFPAEDVTVIDTLSADMQFVSCSVSQGVCYEGSDNVTADFGGLSGNSSAKLTLVVKPLSKGSMVNSVEVTHSLGEDNNPENNSDTETTEVTIWFKQDLGRFGGAERRKVSLSTDPDGNVYMAFIHGDGHLKLAENTDGNWQFTSFDGYATETALTVDENGAVHMVYCLKHTPYWGLYHYSIYYTHNANGYWSNPVMLNSNGLDDDPIESLQIEVKLEPEKRIHVSCIGHNYFTGVESHLWYFKSHPEATITGFVEYWRPAMWSVAMAVDDGINDHGIPHFSYFSDDILDDGSSAIGIGFYTGRVSNGAEIVDPGWGCAQCDGGYVTDIALDSQYNPHIVYAGQENDTGWEHYWYATKNGDTWERTRIADGYIYSGGCAIALDGNDDAHTVVYDVSASNGKIVHVTNNSGSWENTTIYTRDDGRIPLLDPTITVSPNQTVHIAFLDENSHLQIHSNQLSEDMDLDTIPDSEEMGQDGIDSEWDGNQDGTPDYQQANVASLKTLGNKGYITIAVPEGLILTDIQIISNPSILDMPSGYVFPFGFLSFRVIGLSKGGTVPVNIFLPEGSIPAAYYNYGPTLENTEDHWYSFSYDNITNTGFQNTNNIITLSLIDGEKGDSDLSSNSIIFTLGAPAVLETVESDVDGDGVPDVMDNCPSIPNPDQADLDQDGIGDSCEIIGDINGDGTIDLIDIISGLKIITGELIVPISNYGENRIGLDDVLNALKEVSK